MYFITVPYIIIFQVFYIFIFIIIFPSSSLSYVCSLTVVVVFLVGLVVSAVSHVVGQIAASCYAVVFISRCFCLSTRHVVCNVVVAVHGRCTRTRIFVNIGAAD